MRNDLSFGPKCTWLAAQSDSPEKVAEAAGVQGLRRASWAEGIAACYAESGSEPSCLVTGPIDGWVLAASTRFPHLRRDGEMSQLLEHASTWLGGAVVQSFASLPKVDYQAWALAESSRCVRSFYWFGPEEDWKEEGERTPAEAMLRLPVDDPRKTVAEHVFKLAAIWSIDPTSIAARGLPGEVWVGSLPDPEADVRAARERARDLASRDVDAAMEALASAAVEPEVTNETPPSDKPAKLEGMATHMASLGYVIEWAPDRSRFRAVPPPALPFPPMSFGLDDV